MHTGVLTTVDMKPAVIPSPTVATARANRIESESVILMVVPGIQSVLGL